MLDFSHMVSEPEVPSPVPSLYRVVGVAPDASRETIIRAYRRQARAVHPDVRPDDPEATLRFRMLTDAYQVLTDPVQRAAYDSTQRTQRAARVTPESAGYRPSNERSETTDAPRVGGGSYPVFLGAWSPRSSQPRLWASPVRVEGVTRNPSLQFRVQASRHRDLEAVTSLLLGLVTDGWPE